MQHLNETCPVVCHENSLQKKGPLQKTLERWLDERSIGCVQEGPIRFLFQEQCQLAERQTPTAGFCFGCSLTPPKAATLIGWVVFWPGGWNLVIWEVFHDGFTKIPLLGSVGTDMPHNTLRYDCLIPLISAWEKKGEQLEHFQRDRFHKKASFGLHNKRQSSHSKRLREEMLKSPLWYRLSH